jgi:cytochrome c oxidase subunit 3
MAATATGTNQVVGVGVSGGPPPKNGNGFRRNGGGKGDGDAFRFSPARYRLVAWFAIASILMLFVALSSAYIVRSASANDWQPIAIPKVLWLSTVLILFSSVTLEISRRSLKQKSEGGYNRWLAVTTILGVAFLGSQLIAWRQLARQGIYLASNPYSSFFYLLTAAHGLHLLGGLCALAYLLARKSNYRNHLDGELRRAGAADGVSIYWHFMDVLWLGLFGLLMFWR